MAKNQKKKSVQQYMEDIIFFRMSMLFILVCAAVMGIFRLSSGRIGADFWNLVRSPVYIAVVGVLLAAAIVYHVLCRKNKKDESQKTFASINFVAVLAFVLGASLYWGFAPTVSPWVLLAATICLSLLYFIYHIYKKDFFMFSLSNVVFLSAIWMFSFEGLVFTVIAGLLLALSAFCCFKAYKMSVKYKNAEGYKHRFEPVCVSFIIAVALIVFRYFVPVSFVTSTVVCTVMLFQYLAGGIYYTIRLIREA